jgi:hypothetical protein
LGHRAAIEVEGVLVSGTGTSVVVEMVLSCVD